MIKWFDTDRFLPGNEVELVLARVMDYMSNVTTYCFELARYSDGQWWIGDLRFDNENLHITHWAFIEEPI